MSAPAPVKDLNMTETEILHARLMTRLREAVNAVVDIDAGSDQAIEVASTALTDTLGIVLSKIPAAGTADGAEIIGMAMAARLGRRMSAEIVMRGEMMDLSPARGMHEEAIHG